MLVAVNTLTNGSPIRNLASSALNWARTAGDSECGRPLIRFLPLPDRRTGKNREEESEIFALLECYAAAVAMCFGAGVH
jgi:hypothetical protein